MRKLKIGIFAYNWPHLKTQNGIINLCVNGFVPDMVFRADPVKLNFYKSKIRVSPKDLYLHETSELCDFFNIRSEVVGHNSRECEFIIKNLDLDIGIILGARILKSNIINAFNIGIVNMHPGLLPENRGLDNLKWAVIKGMRQGVTTHLIDSKIDKGSLISRQEIKVYKDDSFLDIHLRLQAKEQEMMIDAVKILSSFPPIEDFSTFEEEGNYHKSVPPDLEKDLMDCFKSYLKGLGE
jgi:phosphoribosylglycinamide formyltransferase-1